MAEEPVKDKDRFSTWEKRVRDLVIWIIGVAALINELFIKEEPATGTLVFLAGVLGIPFILKADEMRRGGS